jgi:DNA repair exonuclease SbcCD ATPase subunit
VRVDRWELRDFGSHHHTVLEPGDARLVVVQGENGIGKTTLASEALGHAFFKDDRGTVNAGVRIGATDSAVSIDFTFNGAAYRAIRRRSTRGAGKSSADLQRREPDGRWIPVASGDREVPGAVAELLRMDAGTFRTSVSLAQKDLDRFVAATAAGRKEVLAAIVVDPRFKPAAARAGELAREADATAAAARDRLERVDDVIAELVPMRRVLELRRAELVAAEAAAASSRAEGSRADARIRELDVALAQADAIAGEISRLEADKEAALGEWRAATDRRGVASANRILAENTAAAADDVDAAIAALPAKRNEVERLTAGEAQERRLDGELAEARRALEAIDRPLREAIATWKTRRGIEEARIRELEAHARAGSSTCATCGQAINEGQALEQLRAARARFSALGDEPKAPLALGFATAAVIRLEQRQREMALPDPDVIAEARLELSGLERRAARGEAIAGARATLEREAAAIAEAEAELRRIEVRGQAMAERLARLREQAAAADGLRTKRAAQATVLAAAEAGLQAAQDAARDAERSIAAAEASVARLEALEAERMELAASIETGTVRMGRLRKLAAAFGLKGIPARVIESVLPELGRHANDVLEQLFGMSLEIRAQRASADGKGIVEALDLVIRKDDVGELELERISGGQETAVSLALAIGLSRLNARRAGTAIRTLVVDEPEGLDATRLRALGQALRTLAYQGELDRVVVITHTTELAEFGDLVVELRDGPDGVETYVDGIRSQPDAHAQDVAA